MIANIINDIVKNLLNSCRWMWNTLVIKPATMPPLTLVAPPTKSSAFPSPFASATTESDRARAAAAAVFRGLLSASTSSRFAVAHGLLGVDCCPSAGGGGGGVCNRFASTSSSLWLLVSLEHLSVVVVFVVADVEEGRAAAAPPPVPPPRKDNSMLLRGRCHREDSRAVAAAAAAAPPVSYVTPNRVMQSEHTAC